MGVNLSMPIEPIGGKIAAIKAFYRVCKAKHYCQIRVHAPTFEIAN